MSNDPTSSNFDPLLALYSSEKPTNLSENAKVFDNVAVFEANLSRKSKENEKKTDESSRKSKSFSQRKKREEEAINRDVSKLKVMMEKRKKLDAGETSPEEEPQKKKSERKKKNDIFTSMKKFSIGPMSILHNATTNHHRVNVYTRSFSGLQGVLSGYVVLFDAYMDLSMVDVEEIFAFSPRGKVAEHQKKLNINQLNQALEEVRKNGLKLKTESRNPKIEKVTGVTAKPKNTSAANSQLVQKYQGKCEKFCGGSPQLYYRHFHNLFVKGNSIVLISLPS